MAWHRPGDKPLSELMMVSGLTHICVTRPQWVNKIIPCDRLGNAATAMHSISCCDAHSVSSEEYGRHWRILFRSKYTWYCLEHIPPYPWYDMMQENSLQYRYTRAISTECTHNRTWSSLSSIRWHQYDSEGKFDVTHCIFAERVVAVAVTLASNILW